MVVKCGESVRQRACKEMKKCSLLWQLFETRIFSCNIHVYAYSILTGLFQNVYFL